MRALIALLVISLGTGYGAAAAQVDSATKALLVDYETLTGTPVTGIDAAQFERLLRGEPVYRKVSQRETRADGSTTSTLRIVGYRLIDASREALWLAALAFDGEFSPRLIEHLLAQHADGSARWYQFVNMPWPLRNRHWLIETGKNVTLARRTDGVLWEHRWRLAAQGPEEIRELAAREAVRGLTRSDMEKAIVLPANNGAWVMGRIADNKTLVLLHASMDLGGLIPDALVRRYTRSQLGDMLNKIERDSDTALTRYDGTYVIRRGDGTIIAPRRPTGAARDERR